MRRLPLVVLLAAITVLAVPAQEQEGLAVVARVKLRGIQHGSPVAVAYMGAGVTVRVTRSTGGFVMGEVLAVVAGGTKLVEAEGGVFETAALYRHAADYHLVVTEYTGGAHCCGQYHVFSRPADSNAWRHIGTAGAENGGPMPAWTVLAEKAGGLYLRELDNRFDYFHACHACSLLGNIGPHYSRLSPEGLAPASDAFRDEYARLAAATDAEIAAEAKRRPKKPDAILGPIDESGERPFVDDLGQMLVKRTIFLVRAGEEERAWQSFAVDITTYYRTADGVEILRTEIDELLRQ